MDGTRMHVHISTCIGSIGVMGISGHQWASVGISICCQLPLHLLLTGLVHRVEIYASEPFLCVILKHTSMPFCLIHVCEQLGLTCASSQAGHARNTLGRRLVCQEQGCHVVSPEAM